jgi:hypothetical protein
MTDKKYIEYRDPHCPVFTDNDCSLNSERDDSSEHEDSMTEEEKHGPDPYLVNKPLRPRRLAG